MEKSGTTRLRDRARKGTWSSSSVPELPVGIGKGRQKAFHTQIFSPALCSAQLSLEKAPAVRLLLVRARWECGVALRWWKSSLKEQLLGWFPWSPTSPRHRKPTFWHTLGSFFIAFTPLGKSCSAKSCCSEVLTGCKSSRALQGSEAVKYSSWNVSKCLMLSTFVGFPYVTPVHFSLPSTSDCSGYHRSTEHFCCSLTHYMSLTAVHKWCSYKLYKCCHRQRNYSRTGKGPGNPEEQMWYQ